MLGNGPTDPNSEFGMVMDFVEVVAGGRRHFSALAFAWVVGDSLRASSPFLSFTIWAPRDWSNEKYPRLNVTIHGSKEHTAYFLETRPREDARGPLFVDRVEGAEVRKCTRG